MDSLQNGKLVQSNNELTSAILYYGLFVWQTYKQEVGIYGGYWYNKPLCVASSWIHDIFITSNFYISLANHQTILWLLYKTVCWPTTNRKTKYEQLKMMEMTHNLIVEFGPLYLHPIIVFGFILIKRYLELQVITWV